MHSQKIRHKIIKPHNILIYQGSVIYTDSGYSLSHSLANQSTPVDRQEAFTRKYCPLKVNEWDPSNSKSYIFSLGCVYLDILAARGTSLVILPSDHPYHTRNEEIRKALVDFKRKHILN
ncbi:hypothetical protein B0J11DRAFT_538523 [Dendryphion nanum]|uniref:Protein kinase domain-containing protein n=1 Tax=Dendryphion nanum TaxID=256645 RepID=A0A9P9ICJ6_9PLEO|nr:hypothetical protein B0J11DRAFT_538523 [Dendryphion nanum]